MGEVSHKDWLRNGIYFDFLILEKCSDDFYCYYNDFKKTIQMICRCFQTFENPRQKIRRNKQKLLINIILFLFWLAKLKKNNIVQQLIVKCQNKVKQKRNKTHWGTNLKKSFSVSQVRNYIFDAFHSIALWFNYINLFI